MARAIWVVWYGVYDIRPDMIDFISSYTNEFSFTFSMKSMVKKGWTKRAMFIRILERSAKLFILGLFIVNSSDSWQTLRVPGVLQRFAICYIVVGGLQELSCICSIWLILLYHIDYIMWWIWKSLLNKGCNKAWYKWRPWSLRRLETILHSMDCHWLFRSALAFFHICFESSRLPYWLFGSRRTSW